MVNPPKFNEYFTDSRLIRKFERGYRNNNVISSRFALHDSKSTVEKENTLKILGNLHGKLLL